MSIGETGSRGPELWCGRSVRAMTCHLSGAGKEYRVFAHENSPIRLFCASFGMGALCIGYGLG